MADTRARIESELEVRSYLQNLRYALEHGAKVTFQAERRVDQNRDRQYTNSFTVADLFPDENPVSANGKEVRTREDLAYRENAVSLLYGGTCCADCLGRGTQYI